MEKKIILKVCHITQCFAFEKYFLKQKTPGEIDNALAERIRAVPVKIFSLHFNIFNPLYY